MPRSTLFCCILVAVLGLEACADRQQLPATTAPQPGPTTSSKQVRPLASAKTPRAVPLCGLSEPKFSDDTCAQDSDCGPSEPCHARACVAIAKAQPPAPTTVCTRQLVCDSIDVNRCGCLQGRCALIPPTKAAQVEPSHRL